jgi:threonine synthase
MKYISTRGGMPPHDFSDILLGGLAPDGGLTLPESYPQVSPDELRSLQGLNYADLAFAIISKFATDIPNADLKAIVQKAYTPQVFCNGRDSKKNEEIAPLVQLKKNLYLHELSNGPTLAFKDMAMQFLGHAFEYVLKARSESINIVGATSGDTGSAAEYAMRGKDGIRVFMLSPLNKMSEFQRAQMFSLQDANIFNIAVPSFFDTCQDMVKAINQDAAFKNQYKIGAVNSINWGRIVAQVVYYFKGYLSVAQHIGDPVDYVVPSGNFGNICAAHIARQMGLPLRRLILATNENDVLDEFFRTGAYRPRPDERVFQTSSPSMDISKASNLERFVFDLVGRNPYKLAKLWEMVDSGAGFILDAATLHLMKSQYGFISQKSTHADRIASIRAVYQETGLQIDTHTADAYYAAQIHGDPNVPLIITETAQACKFEESLVEALGVKPSRPDELQGIEDLPQRFYEVDKNPDDLKSFIKKHLD